MPNIADQVNKALYGKKNLSGEMSLGLQNAEEGEILVQGEETEQQMTEEEYQQFLKEQYQELAVSPSDVQYLPCPTNPEMRCGLCGNFADDTQNIVIGFLEEGIPFVGGVAYGECHAAPAIDPENPAGPAIFPVVPEYQWCGNWKLAPRIPAPMQQEAMPEPSEEDAMQEDDAEAEEVAASN